MTTTQTFTTDNRWRTEWAPENAVAAYGGRWIDRGLTAEIVTNRQGFAYDDIADRNQLGEIVKQVKRDMEDACRAGRSAAWLGTLASEENAYILHTGSIGWSGHAHAERRGGYIHVEVWLCRP